MKERIALVVAAFVVALGVSVGTAGPASAYSCEVYPGSGSPDYVIGRCTGGLPGFFRMLGRCLIPGGGSYVIVGNWQSGDAGDHNGISIAYCRSNADAIGSVWYETKLA
ncbi:hypothetical protein M8542_49420 [Amycolatopsis sp. OK19-0408]|uniref:Uncharacterized protein n=1 Tax=Amycolatopsis iheyensis TaxID=2945988 RepID=A0A9X2NL42_9PSEU|nr:hypothetical protein [Amycolatopsis iheyensis]MCR6490831.1 hypothetical protein [Amycolatopsis iheyensis]